MRAQASRVQRQRVDGRDAICEMQSRVRRIDANSSNRGFIDRRNRASNQCRQRFAAEIQIVNARESSVRQRVPLEQCPQVERCRRCPSTGGVLEGISVHQTVDDRLMRIARVFTDGFAWIRAAGEFRISATSQADDRCR